MLGENATLRMNATCYISNYIHSRIVKLNVLLMQQCMDVVVPHSQCQVRLTKFFVQNSDFVKLLQDLKIFRYAPN